MRDPMGRVGGPGRVAALDLVPSLRASLDPLQPVLDGPIDGAIVAKFEVQERPIAPATPVAALQGLVTCQIQRARDRLATVLGVHQHDPVSQPLPEQGEE